MHDNSIEASIFRFLSQYSYDEKDLDYSLLDQYIQSLQMMSVVSNSGVSVFYMNKMEVAFYSANFGSLLGYSPADYANDNYRFFEDKMHPDEKQRLALTGISLLKLFDAFSPQEKMNHKVISAYRMRNAENKYIQLVEQYQVLALDKTGTM